jgi:hypothetical protein
MSSAHRPLLPDRAWPHPRRASRAGARHAERTERTQRNLPGCCRRVHRPAGASRESRRWTSMRALLHRRRRKALPRRTADPPRRGAFPPPSGACNRLRGGTSTPTKASCTMTLLLFCGVCANSPNQLFRMPSEEAGGSHAGKRARLSWRLTGCHSRSRKDRRLSAGRRLSVGGL